MTHRSHKIASRFVAPVLAAGFALLMASSAFAEPAKIRWGNSSSASMALSTAEMVALDEELQRKHDIAVEMTDFHGNSVNCIAALVADAVDICQVGITTGLNAIAEGAEFKAIAALGGQVMEIVISKDVAERVGMDSDTPLDNRIEALKDLQIVGAGPGTPTYMLLDAIMQRVGMTVVEDLNFRTLTDTAAMNEGIRGGQIDGALWSPGGLAPVLSDGSGVRVLSLATADIPEMSNIALTGVFTKSAWLDGNPDVARRAKAALVEAVAKLRADPEGYSAAYKQAQLPELPEEMWQEVLTQNLLAFFGDMTGTKEGWDFWIEQMTAEGKENAERASFDNTFVAVE